MKIKKKWITIPLVIVAVIAGTLWGGQFILYKIGKNELHKIAEAKNYCRTDGCSEGVMFLIGGLQQQSGLSEEIIPWCIAANVVDSSNFGFAEAMKNKFVDWMYQSCENNDITLDDANITIEWLNGDQPHEHNHDE